MIADYVFKDFGKILKKHGLEMRRLMLQSDTDCMRVYDRNLEDIQVTVDLYGPYARVTDYSEEGLAEDEIAAVCDVVGRMLYVEAEHVVFHRRIKRIGREQHDVLEDQGLLATVKENGLTFRVDLTKRIDTGLFLDHMPTRLMVEGMSRSLRVLNLFSYTGSFSVYAARGGASSVESVDLSATYSRWAEENLKENRFSGLPYRCITSDARSYVAEAASEGRMYDLVILDPPSFSNSRKMEHDFDVQRDYLSMMADIHPLLSKGGTLLFSTNLQTFRMDTAALVGYDVVEITKEVLAPGFSVRRATVRTWILTKRDGRYRYPVLLQTGRDRKREFYTMETNEKTKNDEDIVDDVVETALDLAIEDDGVEAIEEEANPVDDDLLILNWEDESIEAATELVPERRERPRHDEERPAFRDRDERRPRRDRDDRRPSRGGRDGGRPSYRDQGERRSSYQGRDERPSYQGRDERPSYRDQGERRPSYQGRDERPSYRDQGERRPSYRDRDERPSYRDQGERRPSYRDRDERPSYQGRDERRPSYRDRDERPSYRDQGERRPSYRDRDERPSYQGRDDRRPSYRDRDERPSFRDRDERRPSYRDRDERPSYRDQGERRPSYRDRDERPSFRDRDDRRLSSRDRDERPSFRDRDDRRPSGRDRDERPSFRDRDGRGGDRPARDRQFAPKPYGYDRAGKGPRRERPADHDPFMPREDE